MLYSAGIAISLFLLIILISKKQKNNADKIMTAWFFFAVLHLVYISWYAQGGHTGRPQLIGWEMPLPLLHGPFLYLYIASLTNQRTRFPGILHFLPFLLAYLILAPVLLSMPAEDWLNEIKTQQFHTFFNGFLVVIIASGVIYVTLSLALLHRHKKNIADQFSSTDKITLNWLRYLIAGIGVIWGIVIFYRTPQTLYISVALFMFFIGYFGIKQVGIFADPPVTAPLSPTVTEDAILTTETASGADSGKMKYERTGVTEEGVIKIHEALIDLMKEKQLYKEPELTLGDLAKELQVHPNILSQVINSQEQMSFYDYINTQRVAAFKQLLQQPESRQFTLLSLAFECGFNSKSSFNRNFKKITQYAPSDYLKLNNIHIANPETKENPAMR